MTLQQLSRFENPVDCVFYVLHICICINLQQKSFVCSFTIKSIHTNVMFTLLTRLLLFEVWVCGRTFIYTLIYVYFEHFIPFKILGVLRHWLSIFTVDSFMKSNTSLPICFQIPINFVIEQKTLNLNVTWIVLHDIWSGR